MASKGQKFMKVPLETRLKIVNEKLEGKSYDYLAKKYGVNSKTIVTWVSIYKRDHGLDISKKGRPTKEENIDYKNINVNINM